jgi:hypothetical protein
MNDLIALKIQLLKQAIKEELVAVNNTDLLTQHRLSAIALVENYRSQLDQLEDEHTVNALTGRGY